MRHLRLIGIAEELGIVRRIWLNFELDGTRDWMRFIEILKRMDVPCITFTLHSSSLFAGKGPYTRTLEDEKRIFEKIERTFRLLSTLKEHEPVTVTETATFLETKYQKEVGGKLKMKKP